MRGWTQLIRWAASGAVLWMACQDAARVWAVQPLGILRPAGAPCVGGDCPPKAATFGHYHTQWREWPGELRPDRAFPQSIGAEPIPTPPGMEPLQLPKETITPEKPSPRGPALPGLPGEIPPVPPGPGSIVPPDKPIRIDERPSPLEPLPPLPGDRLPGEMPPGPAPKPGPGLPLEPIQPSPTLPLEPQPGALPGMPLEPAPKPSATPSLPLEPATPFREETPGPGPSPRPQPSPAPTLPPARNPLPPAAPLPAPAPKPKEGGASLSNPPAPSIPENVPLPVEPWAEPRPWKPEPARQTTYQAPGDPWARPQPWSAPAPQGPPADLRQQPVPYAVDPAVERLSDHPAPRPAEAAVYRPEDRPGLPAAAPPERPAAALNVPLGLDGFCPVTLAETEQWTAGDPRFGVQHQGWAYLMSGEAQKQRFLANPGRYAPVMGGADPVLAVDGGTTTPGKTEFCVVYDGRLYMFESAQSLARFHQNPKKYSAAATKAY